jgi:hypothetical protein
MRRVLASALVVLIGCAGGDDSNTSAGSAIDAAPIAHAWSERPVVGTLRFRDRDVPLTPQALDARGNEELREMTARSTGAPSSTSDSVMADIAPEHVREDRGVGALGADLSF